VNPSENNTGRPIWALPELFPRAPDANWGYNHRWHGLTAVASEVELVQLLRDDVNESIGLVWTPGQTNLEVPEAIPSLHEALKQSRSVAARRQVDHAAGQLKFGLLLFVGFQAYTGWEIYQAIPDAGPLVLLRMLWDSMAPVMGFLMLLMFFAMPWYDSRKRYHEVKGWTVETMREAAELARFETWLEWQKIYATKVLMGVIAFAGALQIISGKTKAAALMLGDAERWRLLTAPLLHGHAVHFFMNALGLLYLGKRIEALARWPHVVMVFLFSAWLGGEASLLFSLAEVPPGAEPQYALGASGGIMGMLGFLLVFEWRHARLVPRSSRRRLLFALIATGVIGLVGIRFIDNAAHAGGLLAGMLYALIVFPRSESAMRPSASLSDKVAAAACFAVLGYGLWLCFRAMM
jgi:membrane associated rhomboid family serine protease